jgi:hypothetical protein
MGQRVTGPGATPGKPTTPPAINEQQLGVQSPWATKIAPQAVRQVLQKPVYGVVVRQQPSAPPRAGVQLPSRMQYRSF